VSVGLLGEVVAQVAGLPVELGPAKQRCVLAALALDAGHVVSVDQLVTRVWGDQPPTTVRGTLSSYVSRLRQVLGADRLVNRAGGYALVLDRAEVDVHRFHDLCVRATAVGDEQAVELLREALGLWRESALTGLDGEWVANVRARLQQERLSAQGDLVDVQLRLGAGEHLVGELTARAAEFPLDERVAGQVMVALYRAGRAADALEHYWRMQARLVEELGTDPGTQLRRLYKQILDADPDLAATPQPVVVVPRQLPAAPVPFVGRAEELHQLDGVTGTVVISAIAGAGGIGKTSLVLHWAHQHMDLFPDGQLFVDLRGFSAAGEQLDPAVAVRGFLDALGVASDRVPTDLDARSALFRSLVAGRRMLVVLDNAVDTPQVTPLLPGSESVTVVVTSRNRLAGLVARHGADHVQLDVLSTAEARSLLAQRLGAARVDNEPAVASLIELCHGFPLALSIVAARARVHPELTLADVAGQLRDTGLEALDGSDPAASLPTVLSWSYRTLTDEQTTVLGLLAVAPGPDMSLYAVAALAARPVDQVRRVTDRLVEASLVNQGAGQRYRMHDLIRKYAAERVAAASRTAALDRLVDFYLHSAWTAALLRYPHMPRDDAPTPASVEPQPFADAVAALAWFDTEYRVVPALQQIAVAHGRHRAVGQLANSFSLHHLRRGHLHEQRAAWQAALAAAEQEGDQVALAMAHRLLGDVLSRLGRPADGIEHLDRALALAVATGDGHGQARAHRATALAWSAQGDHQRALQNSLQALEHIAPLGNDVWLAEVSNDIAWFAAMVGDYPMARTHCEAAIELAPTEAGAWDTLGYIDHCTGDHKAAIRHYRHALTLFDVSADDYFAAETVQRLGDSLLAIGEHEQARTAWQETLRMYQSQHRDQRAKQVKEKLANLPPPDA
jgi:DNA-binding SARP family transcriptional activator/tetratricopeptide (TPR) repeat protein